MPGILFIYRTWVSLFRGKLNLAVFVKDNRC
jgi:hypothetical protein